MRLLNSGRASYPRHGGSGAAVGPTLQDWCDIRRDLFTQAPHDLFMPKDALQPMGYVIMQHSIRDTRPVKAYQRRTERIPAIYRQAVLGEEIRGQIPPVAEDPNNLALFKHYRSLMPLGMEARKPMFTLKPADGAIGAHVEAVKQCYDDFFRLAQRIVGNAGMALR